MDRITSVHIRNVRAIERATLELGRPFTVLIGENGSGKSTILECLELLHKAGSAGFSFQIYDLHRGLPGLLRKGATQFTLGVTIGDDEGVSPKLTYMLEFGEQGNVSEVLVEDVEQLVLRRTRDVFAVRSGTSMSQPSPVGSDLALSSFGSKPPHPAIERVLKVLRGIELHLGFDTLASWAALSVRRTPTLRGPALLVPAQGLELLGQNLATAWSALKNTDDAHWRETMELVRLGLGDAIDTINVVPDAGAGYVGLTVKRRDLVAPIPAANLSDGQLTWLAFVAIARLNKGRSLLAIDEPELHLHPALLGRVMALLGGLDDGVPIVLSTHSDRVLELLDDPADAVRVCSLDEGKATIARLDAEALPKWLETYGDVGKLRESGYLRRVLAKPAPEGEGA